MGESALVVALQNQILVGENLAAELELVNTHAGAVLINLVNQLGVHIVDGVYPLVNHLNVLHLVGGVVFGGNAQ